MDEGQSDESQNRPEKKPHAEPKDEDHAEKICDEHEHFVNVEKPSDKPSILVVMHHTFNSDHVVAGSRRLVTKPNVLLTVDCLFYEGHFLKCERNNAAWDEVKKKLEVYDNQKKVTLKASQTLFYIFLAGKTNGAHRDFVKKLEAVGHTETSSPEGCDYIVRFCPVASQVAIDVNEALNKIPVSWNRSDQLVGNKEPPVCVKNDAGNKNCAIRPSVGKDCSEAQNKMPVLGNKFAVILAGKTNKAHRDFVKKLEAVGQTEVSSPEGCDYVVCFCPVASRVAIDVSEALDRIPADKPFILVVMHHTFSPDHVVAESKKLVNNSHVLLTVDCLFYEGQFLKCERNNAAWDEVKKKVIQMRKISFTKMSSHNTFFVLQLNGRGERKAHCDFVNKLKNVGLNEVSCPEESYHLVIFCYVTSGDIIHAVNTLAVYQPTILVLMYHTSSPDRVVAESRRLLTSPDFQLTVDCLYNEDKILECKHNDEVWDKVKKYLGVSDFKVSMFRDL